MQEYGDFIDRARDNRDKFPVAVDALLGAVQRRRESVFVDLDGKSLKVARFGIAYRRMKGIPFELGEDNKIDITSPLFDELYLEGLTYMQTYMDPSEAVWEAIRKTPGLSTDEMGKAFQDASNDKELYNRLWAEGKSLLEKELDRGKRLLEEQRKKAKEYEERERKLEEREKELDKREEELDKRKRYSLMLHASQETDYISYLPGYKYEIDKSRREYYISSNGVKLTWKDGKFPTTTFPPKPSKLFAWMIIDITANKSRNEKDGKAVLVTVEEWGNRRGLKMETAYQKREARKDLRETISYLESKTVHFYRTGKDRVLVTGKNIIKNGLEIVGYEVILANSVHDALRETGTCTYYPETLFKVDESLPAAYSVGYALAMHYFMDPNIASGTNGVLTMKSLYENTSLPSIEEVQKGRNSWRRLIQEPMNRALDHLKEIGLLEALEYDREFPYSFQEWLTMRVEFTLKDAPNRKAMLEEKKILEGKQEAAKKPKRAIRRRKEGGGETVSK